MGLCLSKPDKAVLVDQGQKESQLTGVIPENGRAEPNLQQAPAQFAEQHMVEQQPAEQQQQQQQQQSEPEQSIEAEVKGAAEGGKAPATPEQSVARPWQPPQAAARQLPVSQAPAGVLPEAAPEMPYAPPFIPHASMPPPDYPDSERSQYWQPGRKKALLIGCNYDSCAPAQLQGCVNDANCLRQLLISHYGFLHNNIVMLQDEQPHDEYRPTKANILEAIAWLVQDCTMLDSLVFAFSGRGCQPPHSSGGSWDEAILPCDFQEAGALTDDDLHTALIQPLQPSVRLHVIIDACQSTPSLNLEYSAGLRRDGWSEWQRGAHQRVRQVQMSEDVLQAAGVRPEEESATELMLQKPQGEAVLLTCTADEDMVDAHTLGALTSTGKLGPCLSPCFCLPQVVHRCWPWGR
eukprot:jgi/Astpho2/5517/fgenesh1_pg.00079_%23_4_t